MNLRSYGEMHGDLIRASIERNLPRADVQTSLDEAIKYAVFSGGKRIRPVLTLLGVEIFGGNPTEFYDAAAASEFIHASSLIYDDLPCMDDASVRRGKTSLHEKFGEGIAVLAAVSLLNASYGLILNVEPATSDRKISAVREIVECVGTDGMSGGQAVDLTLAKTAATEEILPPEIEKLKNLKTSALIRLSLCLGAILAGASEKKLDDLRKFSIILGEAYQISDDFSDLTEDEKIFADGTKPIPKVALETMQKRLQSMIFEAKKILADSFEPSPARDCLHELCDYVASRKNQNDER